MLEITRTKHFTDQFKLGDDVISIDLDIEQIAIEFTRRQNEIILAEKDIAGDEVTEAKYQRYGQALSSLFILLFGEENTDKLLKFFENSAGEVNFAELSLKIFPYIIKTIVPAIEAGKRQILIERAEMYKTAKKVLRK